MTLVTVLAAVLGLLAIAAGCGLCWLAVDHLRSELSEYRRAFQLERDNWERERAQLLTRCMDPSLVASLAPYNADDVPHTRQLSESEEIERHRESIAETIDAEMQARGLA